MSAELCSNSHKEKWRRAYWKILSVRAFANGYPMSASSGDLLPVEAEPEDHVDVTLSKCKSIGENNSDKKPESTKQKWRNAYWKIVAVQRFANGLKCQQEDMCSNAIYLHSVSPKIHVASGKDIENAKKAFKKNKSNLSGDNECEKKQNVALKTDEESQKKKVVLTEENSELVLKRWRVVTLKILATYRFARSDISGKSFLKESGSDVQEGCKENLISAEDVEKEKERARRRWRVALLKVKAAQRFAKGDVTKCGRKRLKRCTIQRIFSSSRNLNETTFVENQFLCVSLASDLDEKVQRSRSMLSLRSDTTSSVYDSDYYAENFRQIPFCWRSDSISLEKEKKRQEYVPKRLIENSSLSRSVSTNYSSEEDEDDDDEDYGECTVVSDFKSMGISDENENPNIKTQNVDIEQGNDIYNSCVTIKDFDPLRIIGTGSSGQVYLVRHSKTGQKYAMKVLNKMDALKRKRSVRVMTERDILCEMSDYRLITSLRYAFHTQFSLTQPWNSHLFFVMEYCSGGNLHEMMIRQHQHRHNLFNSSDLDLCLWNAGAGNGLALPLSIAELQNANIKIGSFGLPFTYVRFILAEVVEALLCLHQNGFIFRDLKPQNVMLSGDGHIRLGDFGISKRGLKQYAASDNSSVPVVALRSTSFVGTMEYMAPEMVTGSPQTSAIDWWAMGVLSYELVFGEPPFRYRGDHANQAEPEREKHQAKLFYHIMTPETSVEYPQPSPCGKEIVDLIRDLLRTKPDERLNGNSIKLHPFFEHICWDNILKGGGLNEITSSDFHWKEEDEKVGEMSLDRIDVGGVKEKSDLTSGTRSKSRKDKQGRESLKLQTSKRNMTRLKGICTSVLPNVPVRLGGDRARRETLGLPVNDQVGINIRGTLETIKGKKPSFFSCLGLNAAKFVKSDGNKPKCNIQQAFSASSPSQRYHSGLTDEKDVNVEGHIGNNFEGFEWFEK